MGGRIILTRDGGRGQPLGNLGCGRVVGYHSNIRVRGGGRSQAKPKGGVTIVYRDDF